MAKLKPYEEYRETGLLWLDKVPKHWRIKLNKSLWTERKITNYIDEQLLSVTINRGIIPQTELLQSSSKKDLSNLDKSKYKLVMPNDIVYNKMRMWQGAVGVTKHRSIVSPAYIVLKPIKEINHHYYHYLLRTPNYVRESYRFSYEICDDQLSLRYEDFKGMSIILPPKDEQDQIARFLNNKLSKINKFIKAKKKQIELLKELNQAIINQAVTKGINLNVPMKDSGVEWIGEIPEHWEIFRLKTIINNITKSTDWKDIDDYYIGLENIESWSGKVINASKDTKFESKAKRFYTNDILFGKLRPYLAKVAIPNVKGVCSGEFLVLRTTCPNVHSNFVELFLRSSRIIHLITKSTYGAKMPRVEWDVIGNINIGLPSIGEQQEIIKYLESKTQTIDKAIETIQKQIDLVKEYRITLISEVVTGKVNVRHIPVEDTDEFIEDIDREDEGIFDEKFTEEV